MKARPHIVWATRSFLDYRVPVFNEFDKLAKRNFHLIFSRDYIPNRVYKKIRDTLGDRAIGLTGEWKIGPEDRHAMANKNISFRFNPRLLKTIKKLNPDIIIGDGFFKWTFASMLYKLRYNTPLVICYERTFHVERNAQWYRVLYRRGVIKITDAMCCTGKDCGKYAAWLGIDPNRITYGHMVADTSGLSREASSISLDNINELRNHWQIEGLLFLYVGSLSKRKGVKQLLDAWSEFEKNNLDAKTLMFVGNGEMADELKNFCVRQKLNTVRFVGPVDYGNIARYYATADIFIIPTLEDNWSLVVPEAMASGLPILCSKYNGCLSEMVKNGDNGWAFDPLVKDEIIKVLIWCLNHKHKLTRMGQKSKEIIQPFNAVSAAQSIFDACKIALSRKAIH